MLLQRNFFKLAIWLNSEIICNSDVGQWCCEEHYIDVIMTTMASQITSFTVVYSTVYSDADQRKHQSSASLAFVWGIHRDRWIPRTKDQLRGKMFPFDDVIIMTSALVTAILQKSLPVDDEINLNRHSHRLNFTLWLNWCQLCRHLRRRRLSTRQIIMTTLVFQCNSSNFRIRWCRARTCKTGIVIGRFWRQQSTI